jgi:3-oxoacyl-(acyl-carrier-protein) synthase/non-ribosomal peptide synthetase component F/acyl carrier protein
VSHPAVIKRMHELLFGDCCSALFAREDGAEAHADRALNLPGDGVQRCNYFSDMEEIVLSIFDRQPVAAQPNYIADAACGDGKLLKHLYELVRTKSTRGRVLDQYPLRLIGIDFDDAALIQAERTLSGLDHLLVKGDIGNPQQILVDLRGRGVTDTDAILYLHPCLDHHRTYIPPMDADAAAARTYLATDAGGVDQHGREIPARDMVQSLVEHLRRWASIVGRHGLVALETHCVEPDVVRRHLDSGSLHFDAHHGFSRQLLVRAERQLMSAAEAGLFPRAGHFRKYPETQHFARVTLSCLERRAYTVRAARNEDVSALVRLEKRCWAAGMRATTKMIHDRILRHPDGQLVLDLNGKLKGCIYSQRIDRVESLEEASFKTAPKLQTKQGPIVQLLALNVAPDVQDQQLGDQLLEFMLQRCALLSGVHTVVGVTRCKDYARHCHVPMHEYIGLRTERGELVDTILRLHESHGATVKRLVSGYRPADHENRAYGVLVQYDIHCRRPREPPASQPSFARQTPISDSADVVRYVSKLVASFLKPIVADELDMDRPLMELGLDSTDLLELHRTTSAELGLPLEPTFFFEYNTCKKIASYICQRMAAIERGPGAATGDGDDIAIAEPSSADECHGLKVADGASNVRRTDVAVIGLSCRLPSAVATPEQFWELLVSGKSAIGKLPPDRWSWPAYVDLDGRHKGADWGGFLETIDRFDASFFGISCSEAQLMDPQQRLLLELSWECLEDAGYAAHSLAGSRTGVYVGASGSDYQRLMIENALADSIAGNLGSSMALLANRVSYFFDFQGPSLQIDSACSSSLVALHEAIRALRAGTCEQALVGGVNIICHAANSIAFCEAGMLSADGKCKAFDKSANGFVRGEGGVVMLLKRLDRAEAECNTVYSIVKGSAVNHGGRAAGLIAPNPARQADLIGDALTDAGVAANTIGYVETQGTGSTLSDSVELKGLRDAFARHSQKELQQPEAICGLGSVKTAIGHLEAASGLASVLKTILCIRHEYLPATLNFHEASSASSLENTAFSIVGENRQWPLSAGQSVRRAGVSSFGWGGANAHVIIEEYRSAETNTTETTLHTERPSIVVLSARNDDRLKAQTTQLLNAIELQGLGDKDLPSIAYTLQVAREAMEHRLALTVNSIQELRTKLIQYLDEGRMTDGMHTGRVGKEKIVLELAKEHGVHTAIEVAVRRGNYHLLPSLWVAGFDFDWKRLYPKRELKRISLPTYPFAKERYWLGSGGERAAVSDMERRSVGAAIPMTEWSFGQWLRKRIIELLNVGHEANLNDRSLRSLGMNSIGAITLKSLIERETSCDIPLSTFESNQTIEQLTQRLSQWIGRAAQPQENAEPSRSTAVRGSDGTPQTIENHPTIFCNLSDRHLPFPLSDIQESFFAGRQLRIDDDWVGCHLYLELELNDLDIYQLNQAWNRLVSHHEMLRAVVTVDAQQRILPEVSDYKFRVYDLQRQDIRAQQTHLGKLRDAMSHRVYQLDQWPLFDIRITVYSTTRFVVHFSIDEMLVDATALSQLLRHWEQLYGDPHRRLATPTTSFRDYILAVKAFERSKRHEADLQYWLTRLKGMPNGPLLPMQRANRGQKERHLRFRFRGSLVAPEWTALKDRAEALSVSPTVLLLTAFSEVLRLWSQDDAFSLVLTFFNRLPLDPQLDQVLGPFISTLIFVAKPHGYQTLAEAVRDNQEQLWRDLDHSGVSGVRAIRELKARGELSGAFFLPVVFTSMLSIVGSSEPPTKDSHSFELWKHGLFVTQTPQVYLDHQAYEWKGNLEFSWDVAKDVFAPQLMERLFSDYCRVLRSLSSAEGAWSLEALAQCVGGIKTFQKDTSVAKGTPVAASDVGYQDTEWIRDSVKGGVDLDRHAPFPLTDQQQAYAFGRTQVLSSAGRPSRFYQESDVEDFDIGRLDTAWQQLMRRHESLVTQVRSDGTQEVLRAVPEFKITTSDLSGLRSEQIAEALEATRRSMVERSASVEEWPYFQLHASVVGIAKLRIHFSIDLLIADWSSIQILLNELLELYDEPERELPEIGLTFRTYVLALKQCERSAKYRESIQYWETKFAALPSGPQLPSYHASERKRLSEVIQYSTRLTTWRQLKTRAAELAISPSLVLLTAYAEVLSAWSGHKPFAIAVPSWRRVEIHPDIDKVVGDFTAMSWLSFAKRQRSFEEEVRQAQETFENDMCHRAVSGLQVLRRVLVKDRNRGLSFPVVFTDLLPDAKAMEPHAFRKGYTVTQTPQVTLDNISYESGSSLSLQWDVADGNYPTGMIEEMFSGYCRLLETLSAQQESWKKSHFDEVIDAHPELYSAKPATKKAATPHV